MDSAAIGQKVRALRTKLGLTTVTLGKKVRISQAQVSRLENGFQGWRSATLIKFAKVLRVSPASLLVKGDEVSKAKVVEELDASGLTASATLTKALKNKGFLKLMEKCAKVMRAHWKNLGGMERAMRGV
jgi:transcriptional regulator with XRE-family HTH domain